ncbi:MAG: arabinofuranosidase [Gordonia sp. (in: high G+C Gram-positive bacteria)]|uniref:arabinofuranosidase n=1 Tax=Gordonia sp. (in: high G+C Gram-positive bacteria) TaxID=84139 RepID=UPI003BB6B8F3
MVFFARRQLRPVLTVLALVIAGLVVVPGHAVPGHAAAAPQWRYTMVAFSNDSARDLDVYESSDGTDYRLLRTAAYRPPAGFVRDASILRHTDGNYYIAYTTANGASIGIARSADRLTWEHVTDHKVPFCCALLPGTGDGTGPDIPVLDRLPGFKRGPSLSPFTTKAWAPEFVVDGGRVHLLVSMSTGGGFVPYLLTATDPSLTRWTHPVPLQGLNADRIDTTVVKVGSTFHAFVKNETKKVIEHATAPALIGPYTPAPAGDWGTLVEGPAVVQLPNGHWRLYLDSYRDGRYLYSDSSDAMRSWSKAKELPGVSGAARHFGVLREPA